MSDAPAKEGKGHAPKPGTPGPVRRRTRRYLLFALKLLIGLGLVTYMVMSGHLSVETLTGAWTKGRTWLALSFVFILVVPFLGGIRWWLMMHAQKLDVPVLAALRLTYIGAFFSTFLPGATGGDIVRMYGAAAGFPQRRTAAVLTIIADRVMGFFALMLLASLVLVLNHDVILKTPLIREAAIILGCTMVVFTAVMALLLSNQLRQRRKEFLAKPGRVREVLRQADEALALYRGRRRVLMIAVAISLVTHLCSIVALFGAGRALGEATIPFRCYMFLVPLTLAVNAIPLSPGGIGQGEGFAEAMFKTQGTNIGAEAFLVYRVVVMAAWLIGLVLYLTGSVRFDEMIDAKKTAEGELTHLGPEELEESAESTSQG